MCRGLPGSGKSTWAKDRVALTTHYFPEEPTVRVNKDDIRKELTKHGWVWSKSEERTVLHTRDSKIIEAFANGAEVVISDDTNFATKHALALAKLAKDCKAEFEIKSFDTPVEECIRRDSLRPENERVGEKVIMDMYNQYLKPIEPIQSGLTAQVSPYVADETLPSCVICDLDGTIAIHNNRSPYDFEKCDTDLVNEPVRKLLWAMFGNDVSIVYLSGRDDVVQGKTEKWLADNACPNGPLFMRKTGDKRKDSVMKAELFDAEIRGKYNVLFCLDDRDQVVKLWRDMGLTCLQVNYGAF